MSPAPSSTLQLKDLIETFLVDAPCHIKLWLEGLDDRTRFVVERRIGLKGAPLETYEAIGRHLEGVGYTWTVSRGFGKPGKLQRPGLSVTRERVRQMEGRALRLLKNEMRKWMPVQAE